MKINKMLFYGICLAIAVSLVPFSLAAISIVAKRVNCPVVHMTSGTKEVVKITDYKGNNIDWPDDLSQFEYGYDIKWVEDPYNGAVYEESNVPDDFVVGK